MGRFELSKVTAINRTRSADRLAEPITVRVSPHSYFTALFLASFFSALLFYLEIFTPAFVLLISAWIFLPILAFFDRTSFDGHSLRRTGFISRAWSWLAGGRRRLKLNDVDSRNSIYPP